MSEPCIEIAPARWPMRVAVITGAVVWMAFPRPPAQAVRADDNSPATASVAIQRGQHITMRDGVKLAADVFLPQVSSTAATPGFPVILARTPYGRHIEATLYGEFFARHGYAFVAQDVRGRFESQGTWTPFVHEREDGVDSIDWLIRQPWCDGKVAGFGASYGAMCAWHAACSGHPNLLAVISLVNVADPDRFMPFNGGAFHIGFAGWARLLEVIEQPGILAMPQFDWDRAARIRPLSELDTFFGTSHRYVDDVLAHSLADRDYWRRLGYVNDLSNARVAGLHITGWYDVHRNGTFTAFERMRRHAATAAAREAQYLIVGPWAHLGLNRSTTIGDVEFGEESLIDLNGQMIQFLDRHLRGSGSAMEPATRARLFMVGPNTWRSQPDWPPAGRAAHKLYLSSSGQAHKRLVGSLSVRPKRSANATFDAFTYDPDDPPSLHGSMALYPIADHVADTAGRPDRNDVLDYTSDVLKHALDIVGAVKAVIYMSSSAADTDCVVELFRLTQDGQLFSLTAGIQRLRYRKGYAQDAPVAAGTVVRVEIDCPAVCVRLQAGDRLHAQIGSAALPAFAPHLNTLDQPFSARQKSIATNRVWHTLGHDSHLIIPVH